MTRYLDLAGLTPSSDITTALKYAVVCGARFDECGVPLERLAPGDTVVTGPWTDWSWLPPHIGIDVVPDGGVVDREEPLRVALRARGCDPALAAKPPKTPRHGSWTRFWDAQRWYAEVAAKVARGGDTGITVVRSSSAPPHAVVEDVDEARRVIASLHGRPFGADLETDSLDPYAVRRWGMSLADDAMAWWIPDTIAPALLPDVLRLLQDGGSELRGSNLKYDLKVMHALSGVLPTDMLPPWDTQVMSWVHRARVGANDLKTLSRTLLGRDVLELEDLGGPLEFWNQPRTTQALYAAAGDARNSYDLVNYLGDRLRADGLLDLYRDIELPVTPVLAEMELAGMRVDTGVRRQLIDEFEQWAADIRAELRTLGFDGSPTNDGHIARWLYDELQLPVLVMTPKAGRGSVALPVLRRLYLMRDSHDDVASHARAVELFMEFAEVDKALTTFLVDDGTDWTYPSWAQTSTKTGRLASRMQQIPAHGRRAAIRRMYTAPDGSEYVDADYAQIEPRLAAHYSRDPRMLRDFNEGRDVYISLGGDMGMTGLHKHDPRRQQLKTVYLADMYDTGAPMIQDIALKYGDYIPLQTARDYQRGIHDARPAFFRWRAQYVEAARGTRTARDIFDRRGQFGALVAVDPSSRAAAEREVMNFPMQAGAAGIIKGAMRKAQLLFRQAGGGLVAQVHDELLGYVKAMSEAQRAEFDHELRLVMEWKALAVPLLVEIGKHADNWLVAKEG